MTVPLTSQHNLDDRHPEGHPQKRLRTEPSSSLGFRSNGFLAETAPSLKQTHDQSGPYRHAILRGIFEDQLLRNARNEIKNALSFTLKETDIYKVFQTGDLANLDGLSEHESQQLKHVKKIRDSLYSQQFRDFLDQVTSCGPLSGKQTDMSINDYRSGCHLLNHDDVIGTRRVSYILYLTDPDIPWSANDGGALELYPVDPLNHHPLSTPSIKIPPQWNQFVFFVVQPGKSFHSVEEVFNPQKSRLSISGWFHLPHEDEVGYAQGREIRVTEEKQLEGLGASLDQLVSALTPVSQIILTKSHLVFASSPSLQQKGSEEEAFESITYLGLIATGAAPSLCDNEKSFLKQYIHPSFLVDHDLHKLQDRFVRDSHISLAEILNHDFASQLKRAILLNESCDLVALDADIISNSLYGDSFLGPRFETGVHDQTWKIIGPPHRCRYLAPTCTDESQATTAAAMMLQLKRFLESPAFHKWLSILTTCLPVAQSVSARRFRPGLDYTLATSNKKQLLEVHLSVTPSLGWEDGELGGWDCYMTSSEENEADPAIYKASKMGPDENEDDTSLLTIYPSWNKLDIILRDPEILTFTKYISFRSPQSKWDIKGAYQVRED